MATISAAGTITAGATVQGATNALYCTPICGVLIPFDPVAFRAMFSAFANTACYPNGLLQMWWDNATTYISAQDNCCFALNGAKRVMALNLMTAHIAQIFATLSAGDTPQVMKSAGIDKVRVEVVPPPVNQGDFFQWWLSTTPYGQQVLAMLQLAGVGGFYIGGLPERDAFRRVGGGFGGIPPRRPC